MSEYQSKIKRILIELHDYTFFHSPSNLRSVDPRFVGREKKIGLLRALLEKSETKSGAYLVTGYKGMGKSSLVNKALYDLGVRSSRTPFASSAARTFIGLFFLSILYSFVFASISTPPHNNITTWYKHEYSIFSPLATCLFFLVVFIVLCLERYFSSKTDLSEWLGKLKTKRLSIAIVFQAILLLLSIFYFYKIGHLPLVESSFSRQGFGQIILPYFLVIIYFVLWYILAANSRFYRNIHNKKYVLYYENEGIYSLKHRIIRFGFIFQSLSIIFQKGFLFEGKDKSSNLRWPALNTTFQVILIHHIALLLPLVHSKKLLQLAEINHEGLGQIIAQTAWSDLFESYVIVFLLFYLFDKYNYYRAWSRTRSSERDLKQSDLRLTRENFIYDMLTSLKAFYIGLYTFVSSYFQSLRRISIRLNLGYNELKEIDVLRLVANNIQANYDRLRWDFWPIGFLRFIFSIALVYIFFYYSGIHPVIEEAKTSSLFTHFFPSQGFAHVENAMISQISFEDSQTYTNHLFLATHQDHSAWTEAGHLSVNPDVPANFICRDSQVSHTPRCQMYGALELTKWQARLRAVTIRVDWMVFLMYDRITDNIPFLRHIFRDPIPASSQSLYVRSSYKIQPYVDYFFLVTIMLCWAIARFIGNRNPFGIVTHSYIRKKLSSLNDMIAAQIAVNRTSTVAGGSGSSSTNPLGVDGRANLIFPFWSGSWRRSRTKNYPIADERTIEKNLIGILDQITRIPAIFFRPEFIFVFDELDKVEPHVNYNIQAKEEEYPGTDHSSPFALDASRGRQQRILTILANLKHFLNTAQAKFIFIAGREMFDAALADVSDRNYFIGSIFHDVIYVESFLKESLSHPSKDVSIRTEEYVCRYLIPFPYCLGGVTLNNYRDYLTTELRDIVPSQTLVKHSKKFYEWLREMNLKESAGPVVDKEHWRNFEALSDMWCEELQRAEVELSLLGYRSSVLKRLEEIKCEIKQYKSLKIKDNSADTPQEILFSDVEKLTLVFEKLLEDHDNAIYRRDKTISIVKRFIVYLTYRSNGAPKKVTQYFEDHVIQIEENECANYIDKDLIMGRSTNNLYLCFEESDQMTLGLINYMITPFMLMINKGIREYGDKLLVSISFVLDHLFKYHGSGFSWRQLELMPEIIDINKAPQLRQLVQQIISFLSHTHMESIISGLYDFRFSKKLVQEIAYLTRVSEKQSAAFNFTLDESLASKQHYSRQVQNLERKYGYRRKQNDNDNQAYHEHVHSLAFYYMIIGDLHFADEEYDDAIVSYQEALQPMRHLDFYKSTYAEFITYIRNSIKLGLAYEKKKTYDSALIAYGTVLNYIMKFASRIDFFEAIKELNEPATGAEEPMQPMPVPDFTPFSSYKKKSTIRTYFDEAVEYEKHDWYGPFHALKPEAVQIQYFRISVLEGMRLMYQATIADLAIREKTSLAGLTQSDLERQLDTFNFMMSHLKDFKERYILESEYYDKVGDILFYKNGALGHLTGAFSPSETTCIHCHRTNSLCSKNEYVFEDILQKGHRAPCMACDYYLTSMSRLCDGFLDRSLASVPQEEPDGLKVHFLIAAFEGITSSHHANLETDKNYTAMIAMGNTLSDVGDTFLSCASRKELIARDFWALLDVLRLESSSTKRARILTEFIDKRPAVKPLSKIEEAILCYYIASLYFVKVNINQRSALQLTKILYVIRDYISIQCDAAFLPDRPAGDVWSTEEIVKESLLWKPEVDPRDFLKFIELGFVRKAIRCYYRAFNNAHRLEIASYRTILTEKDKSPHDLDGETVDLNVISQVVDVREVLVCYYEIELKLISKSYYRLLNRSLGPYADVSTIFNRILELRYKATLYDHLFADLKLDLFRIIWENRKKLIRRINDLQKLVDSFSRSKNNDSAFQKGLIATISTLLNLLVPFRRPINMKGKKGKKILDMIDKSISPFDGNNVDLSNQEVDGYKTFIEDHIVVVLKEINVELINHLRSKGSPFWDDYRLIQQTGENEQEVLERWEVILELMHKHNVKIDKQTLDDIYNKLVAEWRNYDNSKFIKNLDGYCKDCIRNLFKNNMSEEFVKQLFIENDLPLYYAFDLHLLEQLESDENKRENSVDKASAGTEPQKEPDQYKNHYKSMSILIAEAIYCLHKVIDYCQTYGISYMNTHTLIGSTYAKLATWAARHQAMVEFNNQLGDQKVGLEYIKGAVKLIKERLSDTDRLSLRYNYNSEMALHHYWYAKELHNEGMSYREQLESMYYLNDDFNDNRFHFNAAIERYWINSEVIDARIAKLKNRVSDSTLYDIENYDR